MTNLKMTWSSARAHVSLIDGEGPPLTVFSCNQRWSIMEPSEAKWKRFSRLSEEEIQNLIEGKDSGNTRKATKNAVVTFLAYWNEVKPEDERVKSTESPEIIPKKELNELLAYFWPKAKKQNGDSYKKSALMGIRFGLQRHFLLKREFDIISDGEFSLQLSSWSGKDLAELITTAQYQRKI